MNATESSTEEKLKRIVQAHGNWGGLILIVSLLSGVALLIFLDVVIRPSVGGLFEESLVVVVLSFGPAMLALVMFERANLRCHASQFDDAFPEETPERRIASSLLAKMSEGLMGAFLLRRRLGISPSETRDQPTRTGRTPDQVTKTTDTPSTGKTVFPGAGIFAGLGVWIAVGFVCTYMLGLDTLGPWIGLVAGAAAWHSVDSVNR